MGLFGEIFGKKPSQKVEGGLDIEKLVGEYLLRLPKCSKYVVSVSPKYGDENYNCEVQIPAKELAVWAEDQWSRPVPSCAPLRG